MQLTHLKYVSERHGPMGDAMDKHCLQNPLDIVEGVTHAGQAATRHYVTHTLTYLADYYTAPLQSITLCPDPVSPQQYAP